MGYAHVRPVEVDDVRQPGFEQAFGELDLDWRGHETYALAKQNDGTMCGVWACLSISLGGAHLQYLTWKCFWCLCSEAEARLPLGQPHPCRSKMSGGAPLASKVTILANTSMWFRLHSCHCNYANRFMNVGVGCVVGVRGCHGM